MLEFRTDRRRLLYSPINPLRCSSGPSRTVVRSHENYSGGQVTCPQAFDPTLATATPQLRAMSLSVRSNRTRFSNVRKWSCLPSMTLEENPGQMVLTCQMSPKAAPNQTIRHFQTIGVRQTELRFRLEPRRMTTTLIGGYTRTQ